MAKIERYEDSVYIILATDEEGYTTEGAVFYSDSPEDITNFYNYITIVKEISKKTYEEALEICEEIALRDRRFEFGQF